MRRLPALVLIVMLAPAAKAEELRFDVQFNDKMLTASNSGLSPGDRVILADALIGSGGSGSTSGVCTVTDAAGVMLCVITFVLADGTLSTQFVNTPPPEKHFALFGGTGTYSGRTGAGVLIEHGDGTGSLTLTVED